MLPSVRNSHHTCIVKPMCSPQRSKVSKVYVGQSRLTPVSILTSIKLCHFGLALLLVYNSGHNLFLKQSTCHALYFTNLLTLVRQTNEDLNISTTICIFNVKWKIWKPWLCNKFLSLSNTYKQASVTRALFKRNKMHSVVYYRAENQAQDTVQQDEPRSLTPVYQVICVMYFIKPNPGSGPLH